MNRALTLALVLLTLPACTVNRFEESISSRTVVLYDHEQIPANVGISRGPFTSIDGFRYVNIMVEFEQDGGDQKPVSLGVVFAQDSNGLHGSRRYFSFDHNFTDPADPQMITLSGLGSWGGSPHNRSAYIARLPVMAPFVQVFPYNEHSAPRWITITLYLTR